VYDLFLTFIALVVLDPVEVADKVQIVVGGEEVEWFALTFELVVEVVYELEHLEEDQCQPFLLLLDVETPLEVCLVIDVYVLGPLVGDELIGLLLPLPEPIDDTAVENSGGGCSATCEA